MNYLIYGTSYNLINKEINKILGSKKYDTYYLNETDIKDILEDINYNSMFDDEKIIIIKNFETLIQSKKDNTASIESLINYLNKPNSNTIIIFISAEKLNERVKINKEILTKLTVIKTDDITKPYELSKLLNEEIRKIGYGISQNALNIFAEKCASNLDIALMELNKLISIKTNKLITEADIEEYVSNYNTNDIFSFKDAVINKNIAKAYSMIDDIETSKMELVPLVVMIAKEYEMVYCIKELASKKLTNEQIGDNLKKMHPYRVKILREASNKYNEEELKDIILYLCNLDLKLVSEDNLGYDELRKLIINLK